MERPVDIPRFIPQEGPSTRLFWFLFFVGFVIGMIAPRYSIELPIFHRIPEGHVGVYWRGGVLMRAITDPGVHFMLPWITSFEPINVTPHTDVVKDVPCGTNDGIMINFEKIFVVNQLHRDHVYETIRNFGVQYASIWIYDKIHDEINKFCNAHTLQQVYIDKFDQIHDKMKEALQRNCTEYAPGLEIYYVRVTKPIIPDSIRHSFVLMEEQRIMGMIAQVKQQVAETEAESEKKIAISEAEKDADVNKIKMQQMLMEKEIERKVEEIANAINIAHEMSLADSNFYRIAKEAEGNKLRLTPEYLDLIFSLSIANNSKIFFGNRIPNMFVDQRLLGNVLEGDHPRVVV